MKNLINNVTNTWGDQGIKWLEQLPACIDILSKQYGLTHIKPVSHLSYNYVAFAIQHKNKPVVLKISCDKRVIEDEYKALCHFNGIGSIKVLEYNFNVHALLLEQAMPGELLKNKYSSKIEDSIFHYAGVVKRMASCPITNSHFIHASDWCKAIDQMNDPRIEKHLIEKVQEIKIFLLSSIEEEYVCHGDLHGENIVSHHDTWLSIDPKGVIGEMAFEAAAFDLISKNDLLDLNSLQEKIIARVSALAHALEIDKNRLIAWIFLRMMLSAQWFIEDHGNPDGMLQRASIIYPLITKRYHKDHVSQTYEVISDWFENHRCYELFEKPYLDQLISLIKPNGTLLDLGCGTGRPIAQFCIAQGLSVTGVDASQSLIAKARIHCPDLITIHQDMRTIDLQQKFDGIIAWHSFFHLPSDDQRAMFQTFKNHMNDGGILIFTSGPSAGEVWSDNGGQMLYHASLSQQEYQSLLVHHGFKILCYKPQDSACGNATIWMATYNP